MSFTFPGALPPSTLQPHMSYKNIVIVGAATAGLTAATQLAKTLPETHRVVLIEANPVAFWSISALRASVEPGYEKEIVKDVTSENVFGAGARHVALSSTKVVDLKEDYVVVDHDVTNLVSGSTLEGDKTKIPIDKVVLAIGAVYAFPARIAPDSKTKQDILNDFQKLQSQVKDAKHILIVGGGPTGVEFAGEVTERYPEKGSSITLVTMGSKLVSNGNDAFVGLSDKLNAQLKKRGVNILFEDSVEADSLPTGPLDEVKTFKTKNGKSVQADFVLVGTGGKPNTSLVKSVDPSVINSRGQVTVNPDLSVKSDKPLWKNYFVVGDANDAPVPKTSFMAGNHAGHTAKNILALVNAESKGTKGQTKPAPGSPGNMISVPLGKSGGASYLFFATVGGWLTGMMKGKTLFLGNFNAFFNK